MEKDRKTAGSNAACRPGHRKSGEIRPSKKGGSLFQLQSPTFPSRGRGDREREKEGGREEKTRDRRRRTLFDVNHFPNKGKPKNPVFAILVIGHAWLFWCAFDDRFCKVAQLGQCT